MSEFLGEVNKLTGGVGAEALAFAAGFAAARALEPAGVTLGQDAWHGAQVRRLDAAIAAAIAAEGLASPDTMADEASYSGFERSRFDSLYNITLTAPGEGELLQMLRHGTITDEDFAHGLRKAKLEARWDVPIAELKTVRLSPAQVALGIVRSTIADPGLLPVTLDLADSNVPRYPVWPGDAITEALAGGVDKDRLRVMVGEIGLPMSTQQAASSFFRKIITLGAFNQSILEGDIRPEWAAPILEQARQILTAHDYVEDHLRGWSDVDAMHAGAAKHGMSSDDADVLFRITGRPLSFHQVFIGLRRGGIYDGPIDAIDPAFLKSLRESNVRPEWYHLAWAQRFVYPTAFVLRALTEAGDLTQQECEQILLFEGWEPTLATKVSTKWAATTPATSSSLSSKARTSALTALHKSYVNSRTTEQAARTLMGKLAVPDDEQTSTLAVWDAERTIVREELTPTQIKKAIGQPGHDHAWATERLLERGFDAEDAAAFLAE